MKKLLYVLMFIVMSMSVFAADFTVDTMAVDANIKLGETATHDVIVTNEDNKDLSFMVKFPNTDWLSRTSPIGDYYFTLAPDESKRVRVTLTPSSFITTGPHRVNLNIKETGSGETYKTTLPVQVGTPVAREYVPIIRHSVDFEYEIDPREDTTLDLNLENLNYRNITNLSIKIESPIFNENRTTSLGPMKEKTERFDFDLDPKTAPITGKVFINIKTEHDGKEYKWNDVRDFRVISYGSINKEPTIDKSFLKNTVNLHLENIGNVEKTYEVTHKIGWLQQYFVSTEPNNDYVKSSNGEDNYVWEVTLQPDEQTTVLITTNYRVPFILFVLILVGIAAYYIYRPPIIIKKEVSNIGTSEGGISEIKIILFLKNRSSKTLDDIDIIEKIPHLANIGDEFQIGTIKPTKVIKNPKKGTFVKWNLENLEEHEERIITYKIKSKLSILGGLTLPATVVKYNSAGKPKKTKSNRLVLEI